MWIMLIALPLLLFYSSCIVMLIGSNAPVSIWFITEIFVVFFLAFSMSMNYSKPTIPISSNEFYFLMVQMMGGIFMMLFLGSSFSTLSISSSVATMALICALSLKSGFIPFHSWYLKVMKNSEKSFCFLLLTIHKLPYFFILFELKDLMLDTLMSLNLILGSYLMMASSSLFMVAMCSSLHSLGWIWIIFTQSLSMFLYFYSIYTLMNYILLEMIFSSSESLNKKENWLVLMFFMSLPPYIFFLSKFLSMFIIEMSFSFFFSMGIVLSTLLSLLVYVKWMSPMLVPFQTLTKLNFKSMWEPSAKPMISAMFVFL